MSRPWSSRPPAALTASLLLSALLCAGCGGAADREARHLARGQALFDGGNYDKARVEYRNALQIAPKDPRARLAMGLVDEKLENSREAAQFFQETIDVDPDNVLARSKLARLYLATAAPDKAMELIGPVISQHPDDARLLMVRAAVEVQQKDLEAGRLDAERAHQLAPDSEDAAGLLAGVYTVLGAHDKAEALLEQSIAKLPSSVDLRLVLAQLYIQDGKSADAEALLLRVIELKPRDQSQRIRLAQFYNRAGQLDAAERSLRAATKDMPDPLAVKLALVDFLAARRGRETAEKELESMAAAAPRDDELKFALARFYEQGGAGEKAIAVYRGLIQRQKLAPAGLTARTRLAALQVQRQDEAGALLLVNEVLAKSPRDDEALLLRGNIALSRQNPRAAIADLRAVLRDQPDAVAVLRTLARAHLANGEPVIAEETMRHAVEASPKDLATRLDFARLLVQLDKSDDALVALGQLAKEHPDSADTLDLQFRAALAAKDFATARSAADALVALRPKSATGYVYGATLAAEQHRDADARRLYAKAAELEPASEAALQGEVRLLVLAKQSEEALRRLNDFATRFPANPLGPAGTAEVLLALGKVSEARDACNEAIARAPKWWVSYRDLAEAELAAQHPDTAVEVLKKAEGVVDQPELIGQELASLHERLGRPDAAIAEYESLLNRSPSSHVLANNLAVLLANYRKDGTSLDRAKQLSAQFADSVNVAFMDTYGWVLYKRGEAEASVAVLEKVVAKVPDQPLARYHLGMAESLAGKGMRARENLARAVNSGTRFAGIEEARAMLQKLGNVPVASATTPQG